MTLACLLRFCFFDRNDRRNHVVILELPLLLPCSFLLSSFLVGFLLLRGLHDSIVLVRDLEKDDDEKSSVHHDDYEVELEKHHGEIGLLNVPP